MSTHRHITLAVFTLLAVTAPAGAADFPKYISPRAEYVLSVNWKDALQSPWLQHTSPDEVLQGLDRAAGQQPGLKKHRAAAAKQWQDSREQVRVLLHALGLDAADLHRVTVSGRLDQELAEASLVIEGAFPAGMLRAGADLPAGWREVRLDGHCLWEVTDPDTDDKDYVALPSPSVLLVCRDKAALSDCLRQAAAEAPAGGLRALAAQADDEHVTFAASVDVGGLVESADAGLPAPVEQLLAPFRDAARDVVGCSVGLTLRENPRLRVGLLTKEPGQARKLCLLVDQGLLLGSAALNGIGDRRLDPALELLSRCRVRAVGRAVLVQVDVPAEMVRQALALPGG